MSPREFTRGSPKLARTANNFGAPRERDRVPVLLELFTSEGCSSCPPADKLLLTLDRGQQIDGADLIVLSEHVDYWNHLGWSDPYSSAAFSKRQQDYAARLDSDVYTPQLVIDGRSQVVGSDLRGVQDAVRASERVAKTSVSVKAKKDAGAVQVHVEVGALQGTKTAGVYLVLAADRARSNVLRGENAGRQLEHVAVVQSLVKIADVTSASALEKDVRLAIPPALSSGNLRVAVFVQDFASKRVLGVGQDKL